MNTISQTLVRRVAFAMALTMVTIAAFSHALAANVKAPDHYCSEILIGRNSHLQRIAGTENLSPNQKALIGEMRQFLKREEDAVRIPRAASRIRFHKDESGLIRTDIPVAVIFHGLLNSPAWFQKVENTAFFGGSHVLNIRLPGHYSKRPRDLDQVTCEEWMSSVREALRWAQGFSSDITFVGHSTGGMAGIIANAEQPGLIKKMLLFSPAFQVGSVLRMKIKAVTAVGLSGWILGPPIDNERYLSSWAGIQVQRLSGIAENLGSQNNFDYVMGALANTEVMWVDTENDKTLDLNLNIELASRLKEKSPSLNYVFLDKKINISHDQNGAFGFNGTGAIPLYSQTREFLKVLTP